MFGGDTIPVSNLIILPSPSATLQVSLSDLLRVSQSLFTPETGDGVWNGINDKNMKMDSIDRRDYLPDAPNTGTGTGTGATPGPDPDSNYNSGRLGHRHRLGHGNSHSIHLPSFLTHSNTGHQSRQEPKPDDRPSLCSDADDEEDDDDDGRDHRNPLPGSASVGNAAPLPLPLPLPHAHPHPSHDADHEPRLPLPDLAILERIPTFLQPSIPWRNRLLHFTFAWYTVTCVPPF